MAEKFNTKNLTKIELAAQLKKPTGTDGLEVGKQMNKGNKHICLNSYKVLAPKSDSTILEIGMGNGLFVKDLISMANNLEYIGLDYSELMVKEAIKLNQNLIINSNVSFVNGSIEKLPFKNESLDYITTTNTVYFWPNLLKNTKELHRVLKPNGKLLIGYRSKTLMDKIELSKYGFNKFEGSDIENILSEVGFTKIKTEVILEPDLDFDGKPIKMEGLYTIGIK